MRASNSKKRKVSLRIFMACVVAVCLSGCLPDKDSKISANNFEIVKGQITGDIYYIPKIYLAPPFKNLGEDNIYIRLMYPHYAPVLSDSRKLWEQGEWYKSITILANKNVAHKSFNDFAKAMIPVFIATNFVSEEYGLVHQRQPDEKPQDIADLWIEKKEGEITSYISCTEKVIKNEIPQCSHNMFWNNFHVITNFDKRFLPEWRKIKENTLNILESFKSEETSRAYLQEKLDLSGGDK